MQIKTTFNYSPNFNPKKRLKKQIKFIIIHYTGMKKESDSINRLTDIQSQVSSHYLIKNNGNIVTLVPDLFIAWHAGRSSWGSFNSLNKDSIGIEISNPGHQFGLPIVLKTSSQGPFGCHGSWTPNGPPQKLNSKASDPHGPLREP